MKDDIEHRKVNGVQVALAPAPDDDLLWDCYLLNASADDLKAVLVASRGYGRRDDEQVETSTLRHFYDGVAAGTYVKVEPIQRELFDLAHEYWVSFHADNYRYEKKYVFVPGSLDEANFINLPLLGTQGILHA